jgi:hypothetical protein
VLVNNVKPPVLQVTDFLTAGDNSQEQLTRLFIGTQMPPKSLLFQEWVSFAKSGCDS